MWGIVGKPLTFGEISRAAAHLNWLIQTFSTGGDYWERAVWLLSSSHMRPRSYDTALTVGDDEKSKAKQNYAAGDP